MILTDYFRYPRDLTWEYARQCGIRHGVIRLPENAEFDICNLFHWQKIHRDFCDFGLKPTVVEPLPNALHDHIKAGDSKRDESIEKVLQMLSIMDQLDIRTLCFNFMAYIGWLRTDQKFPQRGGAYTTGFRLNDFTPPESPAITHRALWDNYTYFIKAVLPAAERYGIRLALHPDDPPVSQLGNVARIMTSFANIQKAMQILPSNFLGVTMCQATYHMMGENLFQVIPALKDKIFFIHFRNASGNKNDFHETFHDNGDLSMAALMKLYADCGIHVPIRVDHVPAMAGDKDLSGYGATGRLFAIGYLKGILDAHSISYC